MSKLQITKRPIETTSLPEEVAEESRSLEPRLEPEHHEQQTSIDSEFENIEHVSNVQRDLEKERFCGQCGQKNFRPNRTLSTLFFELIEDWLGYDSKIYKTSRALFKPAFLTQNYFSSSHHKNHYITPIRLFLFLSIVFFILTQFAGFNLNNSDALFNENGNQVHYDDSPLVISFGDEDSEYDLGDKCISTPDNLVDLSPEWFDSIMEDRLSNLCNEYRGIISLPKEQEGTAKLQFMLDITQQAIDIMPQVIFAALPILALLLSLFYLIRRRLFVEHLVLLLHSHCMIFSAVLLYLGWYQITEVFPMLDVIPMELLLIGYTVFYLFMSQKRFYQQGYLFTLLKFSIFGLLYIVIIGLLVAVGFVLGALSF